MDCCSTGPSHASELAQIDHCMRAWTVETLAGARPRERAGSHAILLWWLARRGEPRALIMDGLQKATTSEPSTPSLFARLFVSGTVFLLSFSPSIRIVVRERERERACSNYNTVPTTEHEGQCRRPLMDRSDPCRACWFYSHVRLPALLCSSGTEPCRSGLQPHVWLRGLRSAAYRRPYLQPRWLLSTATAGIFHTATYGCVCVCVCLGK